MQLGPESRRQVGDNYEEIIRQLLLDFGWKNVGSNFEINVPEEIRTSGLQGIDAAYVYYDPTTNSDKGVHVESKKCSDMAAFRTRLPNWLTEIENAIHYMTYDLYKHPFTQLSKTGSVDFQEAILSVWVDTFDRDEFDLNAKTRIQEFVAESKQRSWLAATHIFGNHKLLQLQAVINQLRSATTSFGLSGSYQFEYPKLGAHDNPTLNYLNSDYLFIRANIDQKGDTYRLIVFFMGETTMEQIKHFEATTIDLLGSHINRTQGLHAYVWDLSPSDPDKNRLWDSMYRRNIESRYSSRSELVTVRGFNPSYLS